MISVDKVTEVSAWDINEAINELADYIAENDKMTISFKSVTIAREALREILELRTIGTLDEFRELKNNAHK